MSEVKDIGVIAPHEFQLLRQCHAAVNKARGVLTRLRATILCNNGGVSALLKSVSTSSPVAVYTAGPHIAAWI